MTTILGLSASLRGARYGKGGENLCVSLSKLKSQRELFDYLQHEVQALADVYERADKAGLSQVDILSSLLDATSGNNGLSNSEAALAAGLWGALQEGVDISYCNLARYFPESGNTRYLEELEIIILKSEGIILSGPVYFGDRSSLAQEFIEFLAKNEKCRLHIQNKVYGGISVGAKRNGGQETCLVYQLIDLINLNMLGVGNNFTSTSQYGGTVIGGDVGTAVSDEYGMSTAIDTGRRVAKIAKALSETSLPKKDTSTNIEIWLVQDDINSYGLNCIKDLVGEVTISQNTKITIRDFTREQIHRCIACDICPVSTGPKQEYRCIVTKSNDLFVMNHEFLVDVDAVLLAAYSPVEKNNVSSVYQKFIERTRYLRRDDYAIGDIMVAPLVISEINSNQNLHIRMTTSLIRHHTIVHHPILAFKYNDKILEKNYVIGNMEKFVLNAEHLSRCKKSAGDEAEARDYNPIGYIISAQKKKIDIENTSKLEASLDVKTI
ncbi:MAG: NAD(P)H-dependent oxidoreductase [Pseudomonadota bacterium]